MVNQATKLGPFTGGLNTKSDLSALANNELARLENFENDFDGSVKSRPPFIDLGAAARIPLNSSAGAPKTLGYFRVDDTTSYLIASDGATYTAYFNGSAWTGLTSFPAADIQGWNGALWIGNRSGAGGYWTPAGGYTAVSGMPAAGAMCVYKGRLFVSGGKGAATADRATMHISGVPGFDNPLWSSATELAKPPVTIGGGDGEAIVSLLNYQSQILVFRTGSIWTYSYSTDPNLASQAVLINGIGLDDPQAIDQLDGIIYFMYEGRAYTMTNGRVDQLNDKVPFVATVLSGYSNPVSVSVFGRRVMFGYYDTTYVFNVDTQTWSTWTSPAYSGLGKFYQRTGYSDPAPVVVGFSNVTPALGAGRSAATLKITDATTAENEAAVYTCVLQTKNYDYDVPSQFKVLFWWGVDATFKSRLIAVATPIAYRSQISWANLLSMTWADVLSFNWDQPKAASVAVTTQRSAVGLGPLKKFVKLAKKLRFVQINYRVSIDTDGSSGSAPIKVFDVVTYVTAKEHVTRAIN